MTIAAPLRVVADFRLIGFHQGAKDVLCGVVGGATRAN